MLIYDWIAVISLLFAAISIILLIFAIATHRYQMMDARWFNNLEYYSKDSDEIQAVLVTVYRDSISHNERVNNRRAALYRWGIIGVALSIGLYIAYLMLR